MSEARRKALLDMWLDDKKRELRRVLHTSIDELELTQMMVLEPIVFDAVLSARTMRRHHTVRFWRKSADWFRRHPSERTGVEFRA